MDTMSRDQADSSCAIQSKLDTLFINSITQEKTASEKWEKHPGTWLDFLEPQRKKLETTPLPQINDSIGSGLTNTATKGEVSNSTRIPRDSRAHTRITPDATT